MRKVIVLVIVILMFGACKTNESVPDSHDNPATLQIISFTANPTSIQIGNSTKLLWNVSGATVASIDNNVGAIALQGEISVSPKTTTDYTLTASNDISQVSQVVTVTVSSSPPESAEVQVFKSSDYNIAVNDSVRVTWQVVNAVSITISGVGKVAASGYFDKKYSEKTWLGIEAIGSDKKIVKKSFIINVDRRPACQWINPGSFNWNFPSMYICDIKTFKNGSPYYPAKNVTFEVILYNALNEVIGGGNGVIGSIPPGSIGEISIALTNSSGVWHTRSEVIMTRCDCDLKR